MKRIFISALFMIILAVLLAGCVKGKNEPVAAKFNGFIGKLASYNQSYYTIESKIHAARDKRVEEKLTLLDNAINELNLGKTQIGKTEAPSELNDLKNMYLSRNDALVESYQLEKKYLKVGNDPNLDEEEELINSKLLGLGGQIDSFINSIEDGYRIKAVNKEAIIHLFKVKDDKYFRDLS